MTLPPYADVLSVMLTTNVSGAPELTMPFAADVIGRPGFLHGGALAGLLELAARAALDHAFTTLHIGSVLAGAAPVAITPVTITVDYRRSGRDRPSHAAGTVTRLGTRIATVAASVWQDDRTRPIATAQVTYLLTRG